MSRSQPLLSVSASKKLLCCPGYTMLHLTWITRSPHHCIHGLAPAQLSELLTPCHPLVSSVCLCCHLSCAMHQMRNLAVAFSPLHTLFGILCPFLFKLCLNFKIQHQKIFPNETFYFPLLSSSFSFMHFHSICHSVILLLTLLCTAH